MNSSIRGLVHPRNDFETWVIQALDRLPFKKAIYPSAIIPGRWLQLPNELDVLLLTERMVVVVEAKEISGVALRGSANGEFAVQRGAAGRWVVLDYNPLNSLQAKTATTSSLFRNHKGFPAAMEVIGCLVLPRGMDVSGVNLDVMGRRLNVIVTSLERLEQDIRQYHTKAPQQLGDFDSFADAISSAPAPKHQNILYGFRIDPSPLRTTKHPLRSQFYRGERSILGNRIGRIQEACLQVIEWDYRDEETVLAILAEIQALRRLHHPNILNYEGHIEDTNNITLILEYFNAIDWESYWTERLRHGSIPPDGVADALEKLIQVAEAVGFAHAKGITHNCLTPNAVLLSVPDYRQCKVTGWSNSRIVGNTSLVGVPGAMAVDLYVDRANVESSRLERARSPKNDVYSLGRLLHFALAGPELIRSGGFPSPPSDQETIFRNAVGLIECSTCRFDDRLVSVQDFISRAKLILTAPNRLCPSVSMRTTGLQHYYQDSIPISGEIIGESAAVQRALADIAKYANQSISVLITGATGTGKELLVKYYHQQSTRRAKPLITLDCTHLRSEQAVSELFGARRGAYTGSDRDREGRVVPANGGILFLDEIGDLPSDVQPMLLRFLETGSYSRLGDNEARMADVLVVAATSKDIQADKEFRTDLFHRIAHARVALPPLSDRPDDIPWLVRNFVEKRGKSFNLMPPEVLERLIEYPWDGNIRELKHAVDVACATLVEGRAFSLDDFPSVTEWQKNSMVQKRDSTDPLDELTQVFTRVGLGTLTWKEIQNEYSPKRRFEVMLAIRDHFCSEKGWTLQKLAKQMETLPGRLSSYFSRHKDSTEEDG